MSQTKDVVDELKDRIEQIRPLCEQWMRVYRHGGRTGPLAHSAADLIEKLLAEVDRLASSSAQTKPLEIRNDERYELDEVVAFGAYVHLERMSDDVFNLIVDDGRRHVILNIGRQSGGGLWATVFADEPSSHASALPASSETTGWQLRAQALIDKWRATANHNVDPGYLNDCADDLEAVVKAESCR